MNDVDPIAELQERLTYQDDALEKLDQALLDQQLNGFTNRLRNLGNVLRLYKRGQQAKTGQ